nr:MAG: hypothetical protein [Caudoviricetes sp.]
MFTKGEIYQKQTDSWFGNDKKGTEVIIIDITGNFVIYRRLKKFLFFKVKSGKSMILNTWSFRRIYVTNDP